MKKYIFFLILIPAALFGQISVEFTQVHKSCSSTCGGSIQATAIGGTPPYTYDWKSADVDPNNDNIAINLCGGYFDFSIIDDNGNRKDTTFFVENYKAPDLNIFLTPGDTLYIQNPTAQFFFENPEEDTNPISEWLWDFGDNNTTNIASPVHTYSNTQEYFPTLQISYAVGCDTTYVHPIRVKTVDLFIPNVITPNGDGMNDTFVITDKTEVSGNTSTLKSDESGYSLINDFYISNELIIVNRWGKKVYETNNYLNDWDGDNLPDGVYFYILKCNGRYEDDTFKGSITILGSGN